MKRITFLAAALVVAAPCFAQEVPHVQAPDDTNHVVVQAVSIDTADLKLLCDSWHATTQQRAEMTMMKNLLVVMDSTLRFGKVYGTTVALSQLGAEQTRTERVDEICK